MPVPGSPVVTADRDNGGGIGYNNEGGGNNIKKFDPKSLLVLAVIATK
jgi:hypothetical protein